MKYKWRVKQVQLVNQESKWSIFLAAGAGKVLFLSFLLRKRKYNTHHVPSDIVLSPWKYFIVKALVFDVPSV